MFSTQILFFICAHKNKNLYKYSRRLDYDRKYTTAKSKIIPPITIIISQRA